MTGLEPVKPVKVSAVFKTAALPVRLHFHVLLGAPGQIRTDVGNFPMVYKTIAIGHYATGALSKVRQKVSSKLLYLMYKGFFVFPVVPYLETSGNYNGAL